MYNTPIIIEKVYRAPFSKARENYVSIYLELSGERRYRTGFLHN